MEKQKIPSGEIFKPPGLRLNEQERSGKENSKTDREDNDKKAAFSRRQLFLIVSDLN
ncbi:MAG: hypothetical protein HDS42_05695 [Bacteroides sp.]|nr:hypothetical protein [Bacteroides sp.]